MRRDKFDEREADFYEALYTQTQAQFDGYVQSGEFRSGHRHLPAAARLAGMVFVRAVGALLLAGGSKRNRR